MRKYKYGYILYTRKKRTFMELYTIYRPITATPFKSSENYREFEPCDALKPYIRCFWGGRELYQTEKDDTVTEELVTPDTCMDIIFTADFTGNKLAGRFRGIDDRPFVTRAAGHEGKTRSLFAIRFYAWGAAAFAEESLRETKDTYFDAGYHFPALKKELGEQLFYAADIRQLISTAEKILLKHLRLRRQSETVLQAVHEILKNRGNLPMSDLKRRLPVGDRQLERLFDEYIGMSPKSLSAIVRYQCLWNDLIYNKSFNTLDAVYRYGYSDQAHLCHDFKKYHSMNMADAREYALRNVGNIQDPFSRS